MNRTCDHPTCSKPIPDIAEAGFWANKGGLDFCSKLCWLIYHGQIHCHNCQQTIETGEFPFEGDFYCTKRCLEDYVLNKQPTFFNQRGGVR